MTVTATDTDTDTTETYYVLAARAYRDERGRWGIACYDDAGCEVALRAGAPASEVLAALRAAGALEGYADADLELEQIDRDNGRRDWYAAVVGGPTLVAIWDCAGAGAGAGAGGES